MVEHSLKMLAREDKTTRSANNSVALSFLVKGHGFKAVIGEEQQL